MRKRDHKILATLGDGLKEDVRAYEEFYYQHDEWTLRFPRHVISGQVFQGEAIWPQESFFGSIFYNDFLKAKGICQIAGLPTICALGVFDALSIFRGPSENKFDAETFAMLKMLSPHIQTALTMRRKLASLQSRVTGLEDALDSVAVGLVLLDSRAKCVLANKSAQKLLDRRSGLFLDNSALCASSVVESEKLRGLIASAISAEQPTNPSLNRAMLISRSEQKPLQVLVAPLRRETTNPPRDAVAIVFVNDPDEKTIAPADVLQALFSLTVAEARLACTLLEGSSLSDAAELHRVSQETVRTQLKSIFQKTGTRRQGELVRVLSQFSYPKC
jgi:DNA-binding CsgD family transcriptional regulator